MVGSSCHIPYGNKRYYEGNDPAIDKKQQGHMLVHRIQGTRLTGTAETGAVELPGESMVDCPSVIHRNDCPQIDTSFQQSLPQVTARSQRPAAIPANPCVVRCSRLLGAA
jgi:hypothetical protein